MSQRSILLLGPGSSSHTVEWRRVLAAEAGSCLLASLHPCDDDPRDGDQVLRLRGSESRGPAGAFRALRSLRALLASRRFDLILAYYVTSYGLLASFAAPGRYLAVGAGSDLFPQSLRALRGAAAGRALKRAAGGVAWTGIMAERMVELGLRRDRVRVGPRGVDPALFHPGETSRPGGGLRVISTRRLRPLFRLDRLVRAVGDLTRAGRPVSLQLVGEGSERANLDALVRDLDLGASVELPGGLPRDAVAERLRSADVFVSLSGSDGLSASLLEALACGLLPVVSDIASNREVVRDGENGLLVAAEDPESVRAALERAATDSALRERARRLNVATARERFDIRRNTAALLETARGWLEAG